LLKLRKMKRLILSTLLGAVTLASNIPRFADYESQKSHSKQFADVGSYRNSVDSNE